jgi:hypothetical protein
MKKLLTLITLLFATSTSAEDTLKYDFQWMNVPVVCGTSPEVMRYLKDNDFNLVSISIGREGASETGEPSYFVAYYMNGSGDQSVAAITSPSGHETCMMYRSFDLMKPGDKV